MRIGFKHEFGRRFEGQLISTKYSMNSSTEELKKMNCNNIFRVPSMTCPFYVLPIKKKKSIKRAGFHLKARISQHHRSCPPQAVPTPLQPKKNWCQFPIPSSMFPHLFLSILKINQQHSFWFPMQNLTKIQLLFGRKCSSQTAPSQLHLKVLNFNA